MIEHEQATALRARPVEVWRHVTSPDGINDELAPWLRMTVPPEAFAITIEPPFALARRAMHRLVRALFAHRHRKLVARFG